MYFTVVSPEYQGRHSFSADGIWEGGHKAFHEIVRRLRPKGVTKFTLETPVCGRTQLLHFYGWPIEIDGKKGVSVVLR